MATRLEQSTQARFGDVRVGVMRVGMKDGVPTARLAVRTPDDQQIVEIQAGSPVTVAGRGTLTLLDVHRRAEPSGRDAVTVEWSPEQEPTFPSRGSAAVADGNDDPKA